MHVAFVPAGVDPAVGHGVFHRAVVFVRVCAVGEAAAADVRPQLSEEAGHFFGDDIPELELPHAGRIDYVTAKRKGDQSAVVVVCRPFYFLAETGVSYAIARPAILFGGDGVLINNVAWLLRRLPVFAVGGRGEYRIRGIHVEDLARLCVALGSRRDTVTVDAVGPQSVTFRELVDTVRAAVGSHAIVLPVPGPVLTCLSSALGILLRDTLLTREEYQAMTNGLADSDGPATGEIVLTDWIAKHGPQLGRRYANELDRHFRSPSKLQTGARRKQALAQAQNCLSATPRDPEGNRVRRAPPRSTYWRPLPAGVSWPYPDHIGGVAPPQPKSSSVRTSQLRPA